MKAFGMNGGTMKSKFLVALVSVVMLMAMVASTLRAVEIRGARSCGKWLEERRSGNHVYAEAWLVGFLSGMAFESNKDFLKGTDNASIDSWMDNYCTNHPLDTLVDGAEALMNELTRRKGL
jgi:hypothetical protein